MATKARRLKSPIQLWVVDHRKAGGWTSQDLAEWTGVTVDTARGWESRGRPSQDALDILAVKFGSQPPTESPASGDTVAGLSELITLQKQLVQAFEVQANAVMASAGSQDATAAAVMALVEQMRQDRADEVQALQEQVDFAREERRRLIERVDAIERDHAALLANAGLTASHQDGGGASPAQRRPRA